MLIESYVCEETDDCCLSSLSQFTVSTYCLVIRLEKIQVGAQVRGKDVFGI